MTRRSSARLKVLLKPGASVTRITGWAGEELVVSVRERPIENRANQALIAVLADALGVPPSGLVITSGLTSRHKTVEVVDRTPDWLSERARERLGASL